MHVVHVSASGFRNLAPLDLELPEAGAVFLGPNGHGKTNLLELLYYPVLFRSVRGARDLGLIGFETPAFHLALTLIDAERATRRIECGFAREGRRKRVAVDGAEQPRLLDALGGWLAVAFLPTDVSLVMGGAAERRHFLDRVLALTSREYLTALRRYRSALEQRNAALRQQQADAARAFEGPLAESGAVVLRHRLAWVSALQGRLAELCAELGEPLPLELEYRGRDDELQEAEAWSDHLHEARGRDLARGVTTVGPHRDDLLLRLGRAALRDVGSTGQHRTVAIALKLAERETFARTTSSEPALLLDDVFAELDRSRQDALAAILSAGPARQVFVTAPRKDELPPSLDLPVFGIREGRVSGSDRRAVA